MKMRKLQKILYVIIIVLCLFFYFYDIKINDVSPTKNLTRMFLIIACCLLGILRGNNKQRRASLSFYEKSYSNELKEAFSYDERTRKELLRAVRFYDEDKLKKALKILINLKNKCKYPDEYFTVNLFLALCFTDMQLYEEAILETN